MFKKFYEYFDNKELQDSAGKDFFNGKDSNFRNLIKKVYVSTEFQKLIETLAYNCPFLERFEPIEFAENKHMLVYQLDYTYFVDKDLNDEINVYADIIINIDGDDKYNCYVNDSITTKKDNNDVYSKKFHKNDLTKEELITFLNKEVFNEIFYLKNNILKDKYNLELFPGQNSRDINFNPSKN